MNEKISVILPAHNAGPFISEAARSILVQTHENLELIVIDDGSTDRTPAILQDIAASDSRVVIVSRPNRGLVASLNEAVQLATGGFIARMDADDVSAPERLMHQLRYIRSHDIDLCGTGVEQFGEAQQVRFYPEQDDSIKLALTLGTPFAHPTVFGRAAIFKQFPYSRHALHYEDLELWCRMAMSGVRFGNVPETLLRYRVHQGQVSHVHRLEQIDGTLATLGDYWAFRLRGEGAPLGDSRASGRDFADLLVQSGPDYIRCGLGGELRRFLFSVLPYADITRSEAIELSLKTCGIFPADVQVIKLASRLLLNREQYCRVRNRFANLRAAI
ncbi:glycosyltransferase family 2 protein [Noviherbaspirillum sp.]|uniref:glycosyltransferase family 2 protein n=1 Tax=Noviherbaspirillum sp. TaxID=1926288 RepID=UPI002FE172FC